MAQYVITPSNSIAAILGEAEPGDTILFRGGIYNQGRITINASGMAGAPIELAAYPGEHVVWQTDADDRILQVNGNYITITGIDMDKEFNRHMVMRVYGEHVTIRDCHIHDCRWYTMILVAGHDCTFENNIIHGNGDGPERDAHAIVDRGDADRVSLIGNTIYDVCGDCFQSEEAVGYTDGHRIIGNHLYTTLGWRSENALDFKCGSNCIVSDNEIHGFRDCHYWPDNPDGLGPDTDYPSGGAGAAMYVHRYTHDMLIENNRIYDCKMGIRLNASRPENRGITIRGNTITNIAWDDANPHWTSGMCAVRVTGGVEDVQIVENIFDEPQGQALALENSGVPVTLEDNIYDGVPPETTTTTTSTSSSTSTTLPPETTTTTTSTMTTTSTTTTMLPPGPDWKPDILAAIEAARAAQNAQLDALQEYVEGY